MARIPVRSGNADLTALPERSAEKDQRVPGENDSLKEVIDSSAVVSEPDAIPMNGNAGEPCHVLQTVGADGKLHDRPGARTNPRFCPDRAALLVVALAFLGWELILAFDVIWCLGCQCRRSSCRRI